MKVTTQRTGKGLKFFMLLAMVGLAWSIISGLNGARYAEPLAFFSLATIVVVRLLIWWQHE